MSTLPEYYSYIEPNHLIHGNYIRTNINIELSKIYENFRQQNDVFTINLNFYLYKQNAEVGLIGIFPEQFYDSDINYFEEYNFKINLEKLKDKLKDFLNIPIKQRILIDVDEFHSIELQKNLLIVNNRRIRQVLIKFYHTIKSIDEVEFFKTFCKDQKLLNDIKISLEKYNTENFEILIETLNYFIGIYQKESLKYVNLIQDKFYRLIDFKTNTFSDKTYSMTNANYLSTNPMIKYIISHIPIRYMKINVEDKENEFFIRVDNENFKRIFIRKEEI
jgi:hypothetical protein